jgi:hypothetical protein
MIGDIDDAGMAESTLRRHYGRYIHTRDRDTLELAKIEAKSVEFNHRFDDPYAFREIPLGNRASPTGFSTYLAGLVTMEFRRAA